MMFGLKKNICYVRYDDRKYNKWYYKFIKFFRKMFIQIGVEQVDNGIILLLPKYKKMSKLNNEIIRKKLKNQLLKRIKEYNIEYIALEDNIVFDYRIYWNDFINNDSVLCGKQLMKYTLEKIWQYIFSINLKKSNLENLYVFVDKYNQENINVIKSMIPKFKTVNVVTNNLRGYRVLEEKLFSKGILITVSNNKRKSARNAKYILNIDFKSSNIQEYTINTNAVIVNLTSDAKIMSKNFQGVIVNNFRLNIEKNTQTYINEFYGKIPYSIYLESLLFSKCQLGNLALENVKIDYLYGTRGPITKCEFLQ